MLFLKIFIEDENLKLYYDKIIINHNKKINDNKFADSGFDLYSPNEEIVSPGDTFKLNFNIKCAMFDENNNPKAYYLYPRSSISKTPLRMANNIGIIDSSYRGNIIAMLDNIKKYDCKIEQFSRLMQICSSTLEPFTISLVNYVEELGVTERGEGGFGSTGI